MRGESRIAEFLKSRAVKNLVIAVAVWAVLFYVITFVLDIGWGGFVLLVVLPVIVYMLLFPSERTEEGIIMVDHSK